MLEKLLKNTGDMALKRRATRIITEIDPQPGDKIIDIGCGDGYYLHLLSNLAIPRLQLTGTDYDVKGLEKANHNLKNKHIKIYPGDLMKRLPFKKNSFDKAIMSEVAEHLPNDVQGLKEVCRILKPGGILCLTVPHANYPFLWDPVSWLGETLLENHFKSGFLAGIWNQHIRLYKPDHIKNALEKAGFSVEKTESLTYWCLPFNHYLVNLVARYLHHKYVQGMPNQSLNKFSVAPNRSWAIDLAFSVANSIDRLNDFFPKKNSGVAVFVRAVKHD